MPKISILKDINKMSNTHDTSVSDYHTIRINTATFSLDGDDKTITRHKVAEDWKLLVKGWIDRGQYSENIKSTWSRIFGGEGGESLVDRISKMMTITGLGSLQTKIMHTRIWTLTDPVEIELNLKIISEKDNLKEVVFPIRELQKFVSPIERNSNESDKKMINTNIDSISGNLADVSQNYKNIISIGKTLLNSLTSQFLLPPISSATNMVNIPKSYQALYSIEIGNFITLKDILLTNVNVTWNMDTPDINGNPNSADVRISIISRTVWTNVTFDNLSASKTDMVGDQEVINIAGAISSIADEIKKSFTGK
jgi:hypothetical protein